MARRPEPERPQEQQRVRERAPSGRLVRIPPQRVFLYLDDAELRGAARDRLDERGVTTTLIESVDELVHLAAERPPHAVLTADDGRGHPGAEAYARLRGHFDGRLHEVPFVVLHRGPVHELSLYESRVRLVRAPVNARALAGIVCTVLAQRPHVVVNPAPLRDEAPRPPPPRRGMPHVPARDRASPADGVLRALRGELSAAVRRVSAQIERVGDRLEVRCAEPFGLERDGRLVARVRWTTPRAERFLVDVEGELPEPRAPDRLTLLPQRGLRGALTALLGLERTLGDAEMDRAFLVHGEDAALPLAGRARGALLTLAPRASSIEQQEDRLCVSLAEVPRHELGAQVSAAVELWRTASRLRLEGAG